MVARAVTFDLWHTLLYLDPEAEDAYASAQVAIGARALEVAGGPASPGGSWADRFEAELFEAIRASGEGRSVPPADQIRRAGAAVGRTVDVPAYLAELAALVGRTPFRVAPGAVEALRAVRSAGYRVGVISNTVGEPGSELQRCCERLGLAEGVLSWSWSDQLPWAKPDPRIFQHALAQLEVPPAEAVHVGDGVADILGAERAGLKASVLYTRLQQYGNFYRRTLAAGPRVTPVPTYRTDSLAELPAILGRLGPAPSRPA